MSRSLNIKLKLQVAHARLFVMGSQREHNSQVQIPKRGLFKTVEAFCVKSRYPVFLAKFEGVQSANDGYQEFSGFSLLISIFM